jgi:glyoxylase-like metal-dependent hydrolase (beta-lactamase superfamily II)
MSSASYRFRLGKFEFLIVKDGTGGSRSLSDLVDDIPPDLVGREIFMEGGLMVVDTPGRRLLVDAGNGSRRGSRKHTAEAAFEKEGITHASVDTVLLTHGDPDHVAGLLTSGGDLAYPGAHYVLNIDLWRALNSDPSSGLYFATQTEMVSRLARLIEGRCTLLELEREIWPGVRAIPAPGHRIGHSIFRFDSGDGVLFHIGDAAFDPLFLEHPGLVLPDEYRPEQACTTRETIARRAVAEDAWIVGSHFDVTNVGKLANGEDNVRYRWIQQPL